MAFFARHPTAQKHGYLSLKNYMISCIALQYGTRRTWCNLRYNKKYTKQNLSNTSHASKRRFEPFRCCTLPIRGIEAAVCFFLTCINLRKYEDTETAFFASLYAGYDAEITKYSIFIAVRTYSLYQSYLCRIALSPK